MLVVRPTGSRLVDDDRGATIGHRTEHMSFTTIFFDESRESTPEKEQQTNKQILKISK